MFLGIWKAGGAASSNSDGSIFNTVSANTTSGFSMLNIQQQEVMLQSDMD